MEQGEFPTKGNLILAKNALNLSRLGYDMLDRKRNVLIRELMSLGELAGSIQSSIGETFSKAYAALQNVNIEMGIQNVERFSYGVPKDDSIRVLARSIMGVQIPSVSYENRLTGVPQFGFGNTAVALDEAYRTFNEAKELVIKLAEVENAARRLASNIRKTQKRANALKNVTIPKFEARVKLIQETLEERERDEFTKLKMAKKSSVQLGSGQVPKTF